jgi:hypothetical protein
MIKITKTKLSAAVAAKEKEGQPSKGLVLVEDNTLCFIPNRLVSLIDSYEVESIEFEATERTTPSGVKLANLVKVNESKIGQNRLIEAELKSSFGVLELQKKIAKLEKEEV